jgi:hypothetical protein
MRVWGEHGGMRHGGAASQGPYRKTTRAISFFNIID